MVASQNGWIANQRDRVESQLVPGTNVKLCVRKDAPGLLLLEVASAFDKYVENIDNARGALDDWGYAERPIRGGAELSNHASGTAVDLNAPKHPIGSVGTFTPGQVARILEIISVTGGVVRWGGQYSGRKDEMHFEINDSKSLEDCQKALQALRQYNGRPDTTVIANDTQRDLYYAPNKPMMRGEDVALVQRVLNAWYPWLNLETDGVFGPETADAVKELQSRARITVDGVVGPKTRAVLGL